MKLNASMQHEPEWLAKLSVLKIIHNFGGHLTILAPIVIFIVYWYSYEGLTKDFYEYYQNPSLELSQLLAVLLIVLLPLVILLVCILGVRKAVLALSLFSNRTSYGVLTDAFIQDVMVNDDNRIPKYDKAIVEFITDDDKRYTAEILRIHKDIPIGNSIQILYDRRQPKIFIPEFGLVGNVKKE